MFGEVHTSVYIRAALKTNTHNNIKSGCNMEVIVCPECGEGLDEQKLARSLICPHCLTNLKSSKYMHFLEFLMVSEIVEDIDFFDEAIYGDEYNRYQESEFDDVDLPNTQNENVKWHQQSSEDNDDEEGNSKQW
jgi:hypothetical protein